VCVVHVENICLAGGQSGREDNLCIDQPVVMRLRVQALSWWIGGFNGRLVSQYMIEAVLEETLSHDYCWSLESYSMQE
jgi:hypothetical protein